MQSDRSRPQISIPEGDPPTGLESVDEIVGDGDPAMPGSTVVVHYAGVSWSSGAEFDASWNRGIPFDFPLGAGHVIAGWDQGVTGMRVGGRRRLTIPPHLGYGDHGAGGVIAPGETLVFVVDLLAVR
ncbi:MAG: FKBP-type peptidyl-prolyl cis-trans isomerase [Actinomycetota bacterium]|jgi:peptidylprolyl isomerase|nr:FKBP-type peptidyl-prolyl cis-trans isomerase [Actinomycetota bacterium]